MTNYFIIHGSFGDSKEHWLPWLKDQLTTRGGGQIICLDFPIGKDKQTFSSWEKVLDKYKELITKDSVFIGRSIAPIFIIKYLMKHHLKIAKLISISGFNGYINVPDYDYVNQSFLLDEIDDFKRYAKKRICIFSKNDPYVPYFELDMFARCIATKKILIPNGGHFNTDSGYDTFPLLLELLK